MAVPERTCIVCRAKRPKTELLRIVFAPEGLVMVDPGGKAAGRGAYVCRRPEHAAEAAARLSRALRTTLEPAVLARLRKEIEKELE